MPEEDEPADQPGRKTAELKQEDYELLLNVLWGQSKSRNTGAMLARCEDLAVLHGATNIFEDDGNLYITKGEAELYPCYVAHLDTVHAIIPTEDYKIYYDVDTKDLYGWNIKTNKPHGIGGDDKVGLAIALIMLRDLPICKLAFFRDEEIGGIGAGKAKMDFFDNTMFVIECDRRGNDDIVKSAGGTQLHGEEFSTAIKPAMDEWGYAYAYGALTDVQILKQHGLPVACLNMSCGYYLPHGDGEYIVQADVARTIEFVKDITKALEGKRWLHEYIKPTYTGYQYTSYKPPIPTRQCSVCKTAIPYQYQKWCNTCRVLLNVDQIEPIDQEIFHVHCGRKLTKEFHCDHCDTDPSEPFRFTVDDPEDRYEFEQHVDCHGIISEVDGKCTRCNKWAMANERYVVVYAIDPALKKKEDGSADAFFDDWHEDDGAFADYPVSSKMGVCPRCNNDHTDYEYEEGLWYCYTCGDYFQDSTGTEDVVVSSYIDMEDYLVERDDG